MRARNGIAGPSEHAEQVKVCQWLDSRGLVFFAVPNGGKRHPSVAKKLKEEGVRRGVPDLIIISRPTTGAVGVAVEMKRSAKEKPTEEQEAWLHEFKRLGWDVVVGHGYLDAINKISALYS